MGHDDADIVVASLGDPNLFEAIFDRHHQRIWSYLARLGGRECADELAGDVFAAAFAGRAGFDPARGSVQAWLYGIASNRFRGRGRTQARALRAMSRLAAQQAPPESPTDDALDAMARADTYERVRSAIDRLSAPDREVIVLFAWEGQSYEAIAAVLGVEIGTVRSRLSRARGRLRELAGLTGETSGEREFLPTGREICDG
jgi:RNA polymerase sigma factor (sigma-70 family)